MNEEQIKELLASALADFKSEILTAVDQKNSGLAANLSKKIEKASQPQEKEEEGEGKPTIKALKTELNQLKDQLEKEKAAARRKSAEAALSTAISSSGAINPKALQKLLSLEYSEKLEEENGKWFVSAGEETLSLDDAIAGYLATPEGQFFVPSSGVNGVGSSESKSIPPTHKGIGESDILAAFTDI